MSSVRIISGAGLANLFRQAAFDIQQALQQETRAALEASARRIVTATPRTKVPHRHMQDSYSIRQAGPGRLDLYNTRPYASDVLYAQRHSPGALARQKRLNDQIDAEVASLDQALAAAGLRAERRIAQP
jgi:hypothetical protein